MARKNIINSPINSGQGDSIKVAFDKVNFNDAELYQKTSDLEANKANKSDVLNKTGSTDKLIKGDNSEVSISDFATKSQGLKADSAIQVEQDPTVPSHVKNITQENIDSWEFNANAVESDPTVPQFVKDITQEDIDRWNANQGGGILEEEDPTVPSHVKDITSDDIDRWDSKLSSEQDPTVPRYVKNIKLSEINNWNKAILDEEDPTVPQHVKRIKLTDINRWDSIDDAITSESDPTVPSHVKNISLTDITRWNYAITSESDPTVPQHVKDITSDDIDKWDSYKEGIQVETDPTVPVHVKGIEQTDIDKWDAALQSNDLNGYATEQWVEAKGYLTSYIDTLYSAGTGLDLTAEVFSLTQSVQDSLNKADTALQEETDPTVPSHVKNILESDITSWNNKLVQSDLVGLASESWVENKGYVTTDTDTTYTAGEGLDLTGTKFSLTQSVQDSLNKADTALQSFTEEDPTVPSHVKSITSDDISNWNDKLESTDIDGLASESWVENKGYVTTDTDTTYTAGEGLDLNGSEFKLNTSTINSLNKADTALQSFTEEDPTVPSHVKNITQSDINEWDSALQGLELTGDSEAKILNIKDNNGNILTTLDISDFKIGSASSSVVLRFNALATGSNLLAVGKDSNQVKDPNVPRYGIDLDLTGSGKFFISMDAEYLTVYFPIQSTNKMNEVIFESVVNLDTVEVDLTVSDVEYIGTDIGIEIDEVYRNEHTSGDLHSEYLDWDDSISTGASNKWRGDQNRVLTYFPKLNMDKVYSTGYIWMRNNLKSFPAIDLPSTNQIISAWSQNDLVDFPMIDISGVERANNAWSYNNLESFPPLDFSKCWSFERTWDNNNLTTFPKIDMPNGTNFDHAWSSNNLESFPLIDLSSGTNFRFAWSENNLETFPAIDMPNGTNFYVAWAINNLTEFPLIDLSSGTDFSSAWRGNPLTSFPLIDTSNGDKFIQTWDGCNLTSFPSINISNGTDFNYAWRNNNLTSFPANMFDNCQCTRYYNAWQNNDLDQQGVDNILVSISTAANNFNLQNGSLYINGGTNATPSQTGKTAADNLRSKGWAVSLNGY